MKKPRPPVKPTTPKRRSAKAPAKPAPKKATAKRTRPKKAVAPAPPAPPAKRSAGRPSKLTDTVQKVIVDALVRGNFQNTSAELAGVDISTMNRWMEKGQRDEPEFAKYRAFREAVLLANAECQDAMITHIGTASRMTWQAAAWILERRFGEQWAKKDTKPTDGADAFAAFLDEVARRRAERTAPDPLTTPVDAA